MKWISFFPFHGAGYENRTRVSCLGSKCTTIVRIPLTMCYTIKERLHQYYLTTNTMASKTGAFSKFQKKNIKFGSYYRPGTKGIYNRRYGLRGALLQLKDPRFSAGKNLSRADINKFEKILSKKIKSKYRYSKGFNRLDCRDLRLELKRLETAGKISRYDLKDFYKIIDLLSV